MKTLEQKRDELSLKRGNIICAEDFDNGFDAGVAACEAMIGELIEGLEIAQEEFRDQDLYAENRVAVQKVAETLAKYEKWKSS